MSLTYCQHESLSKKLTVRVRLLRRLTGYIWGSDAKTLRSATLALIHSAAKYCVPVWCRSKHTCLVDKPIHALRLVTAGWLRPTTIDNLIALASTPPAELRRKRATLSLARRKMSPVHPSRSNPVHTNYVTARTQIEEPFCTGCVGTTKRPR